MLTWLTALKRLDMSSYRSCTAWALITSYLKNKYTAWASWAFNYMQKRNTAWALLCSYMYNVPQQNWPLFLQAHNSINKASNSNLLGVKWKPLISTFQWCHWIWDFYLNCLRYLRKHDSNLDIEAAQNDLLLIQGVCKERLISIWWLINLVWKLPYV